jgi:hypothetical protein
MADTDIVYTAHGDLSKHYSNLGVIGTLGTADVKGSAKTLPMSVDPSTGAQYVNLVNSDVIVLLRRLIKLLESQATVDVRNRQLVTIAALKTSETSSTPTEIAATIPVTATVASVTSVIGNPNSAAPPYTSSATLYQPIFEGPVDQRYRVMEDSHISYQLGIRNKLAFS